MKKISQLFAILVLAFGIMFQTQAQSFLTNGLVAYYPFNGNANDESGNGNNGNSTSVTFRANRFAQTNSAADFSSGYAYVECPGLSGTPYFPVTYSVWFELDRYPLPSELLPNGGCLMTILGREQTEVSGDGALVFHHLPAIGVTNEIMYFTGNSMVRTFRHPTTNRWTHLVFTFDSSRVATLYLDGQLVNSETDSATLNAVLPFRIGASADPEGNRIAWKGALDDIRIYNRAMSTNEVAQLYAIESGPRVDLIKAVKPSFSYLSVGTNYQLQISGDTTTFTNYGATFTATNSSMIYPQYFDVENYNKLFFRLQVP